MWVCSGCCFSWMTEIICINLHFPLSISINLCSFPCRDIFTYKRIGVRWHVMWCHVTCGSRNWSYKGKSSITVFAPYTRLPRCQRCFESLVTETQEGWALSSGMMKSRIHLSGNSSMKYWSDGPRNFLWTGQHLECSWSLLGEDDTVVIQIGIAYTYFRCLTGSAICVLPDLGPAWRVQVVIV